ncbi:uncharacterized protein LOC143546646 [Bidens hawaiensis]|uniref:uncharacterized protein LOC143546646 n=1 Tax=Bidens hawaiensis TaxID=980011 RepID=UPI00404B6EB0
MTLDNFFTVSELENGLTTPDRVSELITVMQSEKDLAVNSFGQTTRQWSTVATTVAATENKSCLDLFIQLNGLIFINKWLKDSQNLKNDKENGCLDEFIISLLRALEKLQIDEEKYQFFISSGIMKIVQDFVAYDNHTVREKAKELCDNWMLIQDKNKIPQEAINNDPVESRPPDYGVDPDTKNQEPLDPVDNIKSTDDEDEGLSSKADAKNENEISADVDNPLESCIKSDVLSYKHDDVADDGKNLEKSSKSDADNGNEIGADVDDLCVSKLSRNKEKPDLEINDHTIDPLDIAKQGVIEAERETESRERSCSTFEKTPDSKNGQESQSENQSQHVDAETRVSQISEVAHESETDTRKSISGLDLNQEVCSEEVDNLDNGTHNPNQQLGFHDFDLNVAEDGQEGKTVISAGLPSGEESSVANPRKPERLQWDLNNLESIDDDQNGWQSPFHASSSSSKQPIISRNIDLNLNDQSIGDEPAISIFGTRVEVNKRNDHKSQVEPKFDFNYGQHNGMLFSMPQIMGSQSPSPFFMNMAAAGSPAGASEFGPPPPPPQYNFDLNTGLVINSGLRQFFPQNVNEQASSSSVLGKRAQDSEWQFFPVNKRQQPSWR